MKCTQSVCNISEGPRGKGMETKRILIRYMIKLLCPATNTSQPFSGGNASHPTYIIWTSSMSYNKFRL